MIYKIGAFKVNASSPFVLVAGTISPIYVNNRMFERCPDERIKAAEYLATYIDSEIGCDNFDAISGGELADLPFSHSVANILKKPHITIRKEDKQYGMIGAKRIMSEVKKGERVVHVADLITQATSALSWCDAIISAGGKVENYVVLFDRLQGGEQALSARGIKLHSLVRMDEKFFEIGIEEGYLSRETYKEIEKYLLDPLNWATNFLTNNPDFIKNNIKIEGGKITNRTGLDILTKGYPELKSEFEEKVKSWLKELGCEEAVPEFNYNP